MSQNIVKAGKTQVLDRIVARRDDLADPLNREAAAFIKTLRERGVDDELIYDAMLAVLTEADA